MNDTYLGIGDIIKAIKNKWILIFCTILLFTSASYIYTVKYTSPIYQGTTKLIVGKSTVSQEGLSPDDLYLQSNLVTTYSTYMQSTTNIKNALEYYGVKMDPRSVKNALSVSVSSEDSVLTLTYTSEDKEEVEKVLDSISEFNMLFSNDIIKGVGIMFLEDTYVYIAPTSPSKTKNVALGFAGGLLLGVAVALLLELTNGKLKSEDELSNIMKVPTIGSIPKFGRKVSGIVVNENPNSPISEAYRALRTNIEYSNYDNKLQVILVSSSEPAEGKSTTGSNLAASFASTGKKTLLIDCDLRKPVLHKLFKISNLNGLSDVLVGKVKTEKTIQEINENLSVLAAGRNTPNPSEMLRSNSMNELIDRLREEYDIIILDSAPVQAVSDSQILSKKADGIVFVARGNKTKKNIIRNTKKALDLVQANIIGVVLSFKENEKARDKYHKYYKVEEE